jgi:glycosyltransferase involved in cell wall biosynthesis
LQISSGTKIMSLAQSQAVQPQTTLVVSKFLPQVVANKVRRVALVGTLPPRRCGIATFTADVQASLNEVDGWHCDVVAIVGEDEQFNRETALCGIKQHQQQDYTRAALRVNHSDIDVVSIQHEFGIFGGPDGNYILDFMALLTCPCVVTLHTVIEKPTLGQRVVIAAILRLSASVTVMAQKGKELLVNVYGANSDRVNVCPHGAPDCPQSSPEIAKRDLSLAGHHVLLTFGLLSPGKGLETMIAAMPAVLAANPDALYVILGATHPHLIKHNGEAYRHSLIHQATSLGVIDNVVFVDSFVDQTLLLKYLEAADIYVTPYLNEAQITSGTLAYAVALGKPIVSTPFWHAAEVVDDTTGALVDFSDSAGFSAAINAFLGDREKLEKAGAAAYARGRPTIWAQSAQRYIAAFEAAIAATFEPVSNLPDIIVDISPRLDGVLRATDSCGIHQHSSYGVTNRAHGYCILVQRFRRLGCVGLQIDQLERTFAAFVQHAWNPDTRRFRNFMGYDRAWLEAVGSQDSNGRAYWALGDTALLASDPQLRIWATEMAKQVGSAMGELTSLRARCFAVLGARALLLVEPDEDVARSILMSSAENLMQRLETHSHKSWTWFEPTLSYDNARPCQALISAGHAMGRADWLAAGLESLAWLGDVQTAPRGHFRPIGSQTASTPYAPPAPFDQQPLEACATIDAALVAFEATGHSKWMMMAKAAHGWFYGENDSGLSLSDGQGGCYDGLSPIGLNKNQGGESILALQMSNAAMLHMQLADMPIELRLSGRDG